MKKQKFQVYQELPYRRIIISNKIQNKSSKISKNKLKEVNKDQSWNKRPVQKQRKQQLQKYLTSSIDGTELNKKINISHNLITPEIDLARQTISKWTNDLILNRTSINIQKHSFKYQRQIRNQSRNQKSSCQSSSKKSKTCSNLPKRDIKQLRLKNIQQSPYIKNQQDLLKLVKMLRPVKGPNQSIKQQILKYNDLNKKNHQLVLMRSINDTFETKRQKYLQRIGMKSNSKVFLMNSKDHHIRQTLIERGWVQLDDLSDSFFHMKWAYSDCINDYTSLNRGQLFNHFYNNQQLTNKNNLRKNIKAAPSYNQPKMALTFDLGIAQQFKKFNQITTFFECYKILNLIINLLQDEDKIYCKRIRNNPNYFKNYRKDIKMTSSDNKFLLFCQKNIQNDQQQKILENNIFQLMCYLIDFLSKQSTLKYSIFQSQNQKKKTFSIHTIFNYFEMLFKNKNKTKNIYLKSMSNFLKVQLFKLQHHVQTQKTIYQKSYGKQNVWIIKPTGVSRGTGIYIQPNYKNLFSQTNSQHGRIVQKYIQKPFLLEDERKIDLRQWVLVKSFQPLQAFIYSKLYGRICPQKYLLNDFQNLQRHLTNYTLSKEVYTKKLNPSVFLLSDHTSTLFSTKSCRTKNHLQSIILEQDLQKQIQNRNLKNKKSWRQIKFQIKQNIIKTLKVCSNNIQQNVSCFQMYGFDILLDQQLNPFVIQVNLSPACQKRQGLEVYLKQMSHGLIDYVQEWIKVPDKSQGNHKKKQQIWQRLDQQSIQNELRQINELKLKNQKAKIIQNWIRNKLSIKL